ncbi:MAG: hypothetical protein C5B52_13710 [Bacteroidetes bacterium]|nr:MAG: hypothetical protein C5B52_13710 [Bacteroidota bacterium]
MQNLRFNIFNNIHKALRAMLYDTSLTIQKTDFTNEQEANIALQKLELAVGTFEDHAMHEDSHIIPILETEAPGLALSFENEHVEDHRLGAALVESMQNFREQTDPENKRRTGYQILLAFQEFVAFNLYHMNREERMINPVLWEFLSDEEIFLINVNIVRSIPAEKSLIPTTWMLRALSEDEIIAWFQKAKATSPQHIFSALCDLAKKELSADTWYHLRNQLELPSMAGEYSTLL